MRAYHNDPKVKAKYVNRMKRHIKSDEVKQGVGYENGRGCAVGCTLNGYDHKAFEDELGVPEALAWLLDDLKDAPQFALDFLEAIPVGADLSLIAPKFNLWLLKDKEHGVYQYADAKGKKAINGVAKLLRRQIAGVKVRGSTWEKARAAARAAAETAWTAWTAGTAWTAKAAWAAETAETAARAVWTAETAWTAWTAKAALAARAARAAETAGAAARKIQADKLLELLKEA